MKNEVKSISTLFSNLQDHEIIDAMCYAVSLQDKDFKIIYQNKMAKKIIGNHVGEFCYQAFENNDRICDKCPLELSFKDGKSHTVERHNPYKKGLVVEITTSVLKDSKGDIIGGMEVVRNITRRKKIEEGQESLVLELKEALKKVKTLKGLLPICACCNKVRDEKNEWTKVDMYIQDHSDAEITHCYCPECVKIQFPTNDQTVC